MSLRSFFMFQRAAFRALFRRAPKEPLGLLPAGEGEPHPSKLCRCVGIATDAHTIAHVDHRPDCPWFKVMCRTCQGDGSCPDCGGDGIDPARERAENVRREIAAMPPPDGCLACNAAQTIRYLNGQGFDVRRLRQVPHGSREWTDALKPCIACGATFVIDSP